MRFINLQVIDYAKSFGFDVAGGGLSTDLPSIRRLDTAIKSAFGGFATRMTSKYLSR
ncbi:Uncharacterised protein [Yersinia mollaretii]|nr:Uncharacterised protein [Yersinia mollaretii]